MDQQLIDEAAHALGVSVGQPMRQGGQKFVALATRAHEEVVLKIADLSGPYGQVALERARREVALLGDLSHPMVVSVESSLAEIGDSAIRAVAWLEEYIDGEDLRDRLGVQWTWSDAYQMLVDVAGGLTAFHSRGVVHRDLSPGNIRWARADGQYRILDPGFARHLGRTSITGAHQPGTPGYLSPEHVAVAAEPTAASDVFCVGILGYEALTGDLPIELGSDLAEYQRVLTAEQAPSLRLARPDLDASQVDVIDTCLKRNMARRYNDASELSLILADLA